MRLAMPAVALASPRTKRRTSSRNQPLNSAQRPQAGNLPSCDRPAASHASAISLVLRQHGMFGDVLEERRVLQHFAAGPAAEDGGQIEAETVDVQLGHQVRQAIDDEIAHQRMIAVERVAAAGEVVIAAFLVEHVIDGVIQSAEADAGAVFVAFAGVVVDHVENDLDAGAVTGFHQSP